jgi:hypothetical protein
MLLRPTPRRPRLSNDRRGLDLRAQELLLIQSIIKALDPGLWCTALDLKDAFFHSPARESHRRYLRFKVGHRHFQFRVLPFGLTASPFVLTRICKAVGAFVHAQRVRLIQYLDDWLLGSDSAQETDLQTTWLLSLARALGFEANLEKSDLTPSQIF